MPSPKDILSIDSADVAKFIQDQAAAKKLTPLIKSLNKLLEASDEATRNMAARALSHLGFPEYA